MIRGFESHLGLFPQGMTTAACRWQAAVLCLISEELDGPEGQKQSKVCTADFAIPVEVFWTT